MARRFTIHPPYLVDRIRSEVVIEGPEGPLRGSDVDLEKSLNTVFSELHRWLRYVRDTEDGNAVDLTQVEITVAAPPTVGGIIHLGGASSPYVVQAGDELLLVDASSGPFTVTLPNALQSEGRLLRVKKIDSSFNTVTLSGQVDGDTDFTLLFEDEVVAVVCDGTEWWII